MNGQHGVTQILNALEQNPQASDDLLPLVYQELRQLASDRLRQERPGQTLQATALVHEAYLRLVDVKHQQSWDSRHHFFAAAAEAMRRIVIENARRKQTTKRGGGLIRRMLVDEELTTDNPNIDLLALNEALDRLETEDAKAAMLVKLRYFSGLTVSQSAEVLDLSTRSTERLWAYAKAWLFEALS